MGVRFSVEPLPPHPSLEHQQKLAKRLLREVWAGATEAIERVQAFLPGRFSSPGHLESMKLHDAQRVVARSYGFESWAAMKRKIESLTRTPLQQFDAAVREGDAALARELLARHAELRTKINEPRFDFDSPALHQAKGNLPLVDVLLEYGADINARSTFWAGSFGILEHGITLDGAKPLIERGAKLTIWAAAGLGLVQDLKAILAATPGVVHERGGDGKTALHCAATREIAEILVNAGAELDARDRDHNATPLQYLIGDEEIVKLLIERGASVDLFAVARWGDSPLVERCLRDDPASADERIGRGKFTAPGLHIYGWTLGLGQTLGFDLSPADVARKFGHPQIAEKIVSRLSPEARLADALWCGDRERARAEISQRPNAVQEMHPADRSLLASAAWWYRPESVRLMLEVGMDPHVPGAHRSTPLDRASFHGYADIVSMLLEEDPHPPITDRNEFGGIPLGACVYGALNGWKTGFPQDHARTLTLLLEAGSPLDPTLLPTGNDELDSVMRQWLKKETERHGNT
ncbi:MAG TPA: ankyrin repeat domain-containing protein [Steroidobacteraceae bacterium]|jgi:ankyrin repeat protein